MLADLAESRGRRDPAAARFFLAPALLEPAFGLMTAPRRRREAKAPWSSPEPIRVGEAPWPRRHARPAPPSARRGDTPSRSGHAVAPHAVPHEPLVRTDASLRS